MKKHLIIAFLTIVINLTSEKYHFSQSDAFLGVIFEHNYKGKGIKIDEIVKDSPADVYGLKQKIILYKINNIDVNSENDFKNIIKNIKPGEILEISTNTSKEVYKIPLIKRIKFEKYQIISSLDQKQIGVKLRNLNKQLLNFFKVKNGVFIYEIANNSIAQKNGLKAGDIILSINNTTINNISEFKHIINTTSTNDCLILDIKRKEKKIRIKMRIIDLNLSEDSIL